MDQSLDELFVEITGYAVPMETLTPAPTVFMDVAADLGMTLAPSGFEIAADLISSAVDFLSERSMRDFIDIVEYVAPGAQVTFGDTVADKARQRFQADLGQTRTVLAKGQIAQLAQCPFWLGDLTEAGAKAASSESIVSGMYDPKADIVYVSVRHGMRDGHYTWCALHELGHRFHYRTKGRKAATTPQDIDQHIQAFYDWAKANDVCPSGYAEQDRWEFFAECFVHFLMGRQMDKRVQAWTKKVLETFRGSCRYA